MLDNGGSVKPKDMEFMSGSMVIVMKENLSNV